MFNFFKKRYESRDYDASHLSDKDAVIVFCQRAEAYRDFYALGIGTENDARASLDVAVAAAARRFDLHRSAPGSLDRPRYRTFLQEELTRQARQIYAGASPIEFFVVQFADPKLLRNYGR
jgi:hypothetical protein